MRYGLASGLPIGSMQGSEPSAVSMSGDVTGRSDVHLANHVAAVDTVDQKRRDY